MDGAGLYLARRQPGHDVDAASPTAPSKPLTVPFTAGLGPNTVVPRGHRRRGRPNRLAGLYIGSIFNSPDPSQATLLPQ